VYKRQTYEEWKLHPDSWYIACSIRSNTKVWGIARTTKPVLSTKFTDREGNPGIAYIAFKTSMAIPVAGANLRFPPADRSIIAKHAEKLWKEAEGLGDDTGRPLPLAQAARRLRRIQDVRKHFDL